MRPPNSTEYALTRPQIKRDATARTTVRSVCTAANLAAEGALIVPFDIAPRRKFSKLSVGGSALTLDTAEKEGAL